MPEPAEVPLRAAAGDQRASLLGRHAAARTTYVPPPPPPPPACAAALLMTLPRECSNFMTVTGPGTRWANFGAPWNASTPPCGDAATGALKWRGLKCTNGSVGGV